MGVPPLLLTVLNSFSETYSDNLLLDNFGEEDEVCEDSSRIFLAVKISIILSEAFFLVDLLSLLGFLSQFGLS